MRGSGVVIIIKKGIAFTRFFDIPNAKAIFCKIIFDERVIFVGAVYRKPNTVIDNMLALYEYMQSYRKDRRLVMMGDISLPNVN